MLSFIYINSPKLPEAMPCDVMNEQLHMANSLFSLFKEKKMKKNDLKT